MTQPAGRGATVDFRFRNAKQVEFVAHEVDVRKLLDDVKAYLKSKPKQLEWEQMNISDIGYRLVQEDQKKYIGAEVARWKLDLEPREKHSTNASPSPRRCKKPARTWSRPRSTTATRRKIVLWLADTAIVRKPMTDKSFYYVADAVTGAPIAKANVEFFGYRQKHIDGNNYQIDTKNFAEATDENGQAFLPIPDDDKDQAAREFQWLAIATTHDGRLAYLGFHNVWRSHYYDAQYNEVKTFAITDRPVYRPGQAVQFKFWIRQAQYDADDKSRIRASIVRRRNSQSEGRKGLQRNAHLRQLRRHRRQVRAARRRHARPVPAASSSTAAAARSASRNTRSPSTKSRSTRRPSRSCSAKRSRPRSSAKYYFGSPVTNATVKYKVHAQRAHGPLVSARPVGLALRPRLLVVRVRLRLVSRLARLGLPPAVAVVVLAPAVRRRKSSPSAKCRSAPTARSRSRSTRRSPRQLHPDHDHRYQIQAEVVDQSRRTIVGNGDVLVARKPFQVYRLGRSRLLPRRRHDQSQLRRPPPRRQTGRRRRQAAAAEDHLRRRPERKPIETEVKNWNLATNAEGLADIQLKASEKGQYRLSYEVTDKAGHEIEGGYLFTIIGEGFDGSEFRFNNLEIVPDKREYAPDEKVSAAAQHQSRRLDRAAVRAPVERRLPAAASCCSSPARARSSKSASRKRTCRTFSSKR